MADKIAGVALTHYAPRHQGASTKLQRSTKEAFISHLSPRCELLPTLISLQTCGAIFSPSGFDP
jgi:hypothetical protein